MTSSCARLAVELEHAEVGEDLTAFDISHLGAIRLLRSDHIATDSSLKLEAVKGSRWIRTALYLAFWSNYRFVVNVLIGVIKFPCGLSLQLAHALVSSSHIFCSPYLSVLSFPACAVPSVEIRSIRWCASIIVHAFDLAGLAFIYWCRLWPSEAARWASTARERAPTVLVEGLLEVSFYGCLALALGLGSVELDARVIALQAS